MVTKTGIMDGWVKLGLVGAALFGGGYAASGEEDFEVTVEKSPSEVYSAFSGARTFNGGLRNAGYAKVSVRTERPSKNEIIYRSGKEGSRNSMRIALKMVLGATPRQTTLTAAIDVPAVRYEADGEDLVLSERKVEKVFEENLNAVAVRLSNGGDAQDELNEFRDQLDLVALVTQPDQFKSVEDSLKDAS